MEWKEIIAWVKELLPAQLRVPFTTGIMVLALLCLSTIFIEGIEWTEVFRVWWTLLAAAAASAYWATVVFRVRKSIIWPWPNSPSLTLAVALVLVAVGLALFSYDRSRYRYDSRFFSSRNWRPDRKHGKGYFEWSLEPTTDAGRDKTFILNLELKGNCDLRRFEGPAPERDSNTMHGPVITDNSTLGSSNITWTVKDLHRGEELKLRLFVKDENGSADSICFTPHLQSQ